MTDAATNRARIIRWMGRHTGDFVDPTCNVLNSTALAEAAASDFDEYGPAPDYEIPEWIWETAAAIAGEPRFNQ